MSGGLAVDKEEARSEVEQVTLRFIDLARQMEAFFLQKRFLLSALKPELVVKEDINDLRLELARKEDLIKRHYDKIAVWQNLLADLQGWAKSPAQGPAPNGENLKKKRSRNVCNDFKIVQVYQTARKAGRANRPRTAAELRRCSNSSKYCSTSSSFNNNSCSIYSSIKCSSNSFISNRYLSNTVTGKAETPVFRQLLN